MAFFNTLFTFDYFYKWLANNADLLKNVNNTAASKHPCPSKRHIFERIKKDIFAKIKQLTQILTNFENICIKPL